MTKDITTATSTEMSLYDDYEEQAGLGLEEAGADAFAVPFLAILQSNSPQCKRSEGAYIEGAQEGFLLDTVAQKYIDPSFDTFIVPVHFRQTFVEWKPNRGGFVAEHAANSPVQHQAVRTEVEKDKWRDILPNGNELVDTRKHYVLLIDPDTGLGRPIIIAMSSTQTRQSKRLMSMLDNLKVPSKKNPGAYFTPPTYASVCRVTTAPESNDKGSWYGWQITMHGPQNDPNVREQAENFRKALLAGDIQEATDSQVDEEPSTEF